MWSKSTMEKEINGKSYNIKEITYLDALEIEESRKTSLKDAAKKFIQFSTGLSDEEVSKLSLKDGTELQKLCNKVNDLDFQDPAKN